MHGVIVFCIGLECRHPVKFKYYSNPKATAPLLDGASCAYCVGSFGAKRFIVDELLTIEWKSVLPICEDCRAHGGALTVARTIRRNGAANAQLHAHRDHLTANAPQTHVDVVTPMKATDIPTAPRITKRGRRAYF
jgi:hypothetical protein